MSSGQRSAVFLDSSLGRMRAGGLSVLIGLSVWVASAAAQSGECFKKAGECTDSRAKDYSPPASLTSTLCGINATVWRAELIISSDQDSPSGPWAKPAPAWPIVCNPQHPNDIIWSLQCGELYVDTDGDGVCETWFGPAGGNAVIVCGRG
jgi:hypothetical protein